MSTRTTAQIRLIEKRPQHDDVLNSIIASARADHFSQLPPEVAEQVVTMQVAAQRADYQRNYPDAIDRLILAADGSVVGRMLHQRHSDYIQLIDIAVLTAHRGLGYGTEALRELCTWADTLRLNIRLTVSTTAPAVHRWYRRTGFQDAGTTATHVAMTRPPAKETS